MKWHYGCALNVTILFCEYNMRAALPSNLKAIIFENFNRLFTANWHKVLNSYGCQECSVVCVINLILLFCLLKVKFEGLF